MGYSLPGSSIHGIFQTRLLEWVAISFSRGSSRPRDWTRVSCIVGRRFMIWATRGVPSFILKDNVLTRHNLENLHSDSNLQRACTLFYLYFALGKMLFHFCFSHLSLAVILVFFGVLNFHSIVLECVGVGGEGVLVMVRRNKNITKYIRCHKNKLLKK